MITSLGRLGRGQYFSDDPSMDPGVRLSQTFGPGFALDDVRVVGYRHHPAIAAPVAV